MAIKTAISGVGATVWLKSFVTHLAATGLDEPSFVLTGDDTKQLKQTAAELRKEIDENKSPATVEVQTDRLLAFDGADYIFHGPAVTAAAASGDNDDPDLAGLFRVQRDVVEILECAADMRDAADPDAILVVHGENAGARVRAAVEFGDVTALGAARIDVDGILRLTKVIDHTVNRGKKPDSRGYHPVGPMDLGLLRAGVDDLSWYLQVIYGNEDWAPRLPELFPACPEALKGAEALGGLLRTFGLFPAGGEVEPCPFSARGAANLVASLETEGILREHFRVVNDRAITNLPDDAVVEVPCYSDINGIAVPTVGDLPPGCAALCSQEAWTQRLAVEAAVSGDMELLRQAAFLAVGHAPGLERKLDEMLMARAKSLPQYAPAIAAVRRRLDTAKSVKPAKSAKSAKSGRKR